jgi:hypothetical protein
MVQPPEKVCYVFYTNYKKARWERWFRVLHDQVKDV